MEEASFSSDCRQLLKSKLHLGFREPHGRIKARTSITRIQTPIDRSHRQVVACLHSRFHITLGPDASHSSYLFPNLLSSLGWVEILNRSFSVTMHTIQILLPSTGMHACMQRLSLPTFLRSGQSLPPITLNMCNTHGFVFPPSSTLFRGRGYFMSVL